MDGIPESLPRLSIGRDWEERLLWMTGMALNNCDCISGVPSRLGREGGMALGDAEDWVRSGEGDRRTGRDTFRTLLGDEVSSLKCCEDFRGGGLGGGGGSFLFFLMVASRTVEFEEEEASDSLTDANPWGSAVIASTSFGMLPALRLVTGGLVIEGLCNRPLTWLLR